MMINFKNASGLNINKSKTKILQVGKKKWDVRHLRLNEVEKIYSLGTWFYKDNNTINTYNCEEKYKQFEGILQYWKQTLRKQ
mgnify:CR=1 FL=1